MRSDNLKRHEGSCKNKNERVVVVNSSLKKRMKLAPTVVDDDIINKIINGEKVKSNKPAEEEGEVIEIDLPNKVVKLPLLPKPKTKKLIAHSVPTQQYLPSSEEGLKEKLRVLYAECAAGNTATKPLIVEILQEFRRRGVLNNAECEDVCNIIESLEESSSATNSSGESSSFEVDSSEKSSGSETDESEELDFDNLVKITVENLTGNTKRNLHKALQEMDKDISEMVTKYIDGEGEFEDVLEKLGKSNDGMKVKMLLRSVENTRNRVKKVLETLRDTEEKDIGKVLEHLKMHDQISEEEFRRLLVSANDILSYSKAIQGSGFWL